MVNCNPETVSTDYDTSRPALLRAAHPGGRAGDRRTREAGGAHRPVRRADPAQAGGAARRGRACPSSAPRPDAIDRAEDRERFAELIDKLGLRQPENGMARSAEEAFAVAQPHRLPGDGAPLLRAGRPGHGGGLRRRRPARLPDRGGAGLRRAAGAGRPLPARTPPRWTSTWSPTARTWWWAG